MKKLFFLLPFIFLGCQTPNLDSINPLQTKEECNPQYFLEYQSKHPDRIVGVGIAKRNYYGEAAQRKSAISKALNEIAYQKGVKVTSISASSAAKYGNRVNRNYQSYSLQTVNGKSVKAKIIKECKKDGKLYILMEAY